MAIWRLFGRIVEVDSTGEVAHQKTNRELPGSRLTGPFEEIVNLRIAHPLIEQQFSKVADGSHQFAFAVTFVTTSPA